MILDRVSLSVPPQVAARPKTEAPVGEPRDTVEPGRELPPGWSYTPRLTQQRVDVPFPYPGEVLEQNETPELVQRLRSQGNPGAARGILENWLSLGERYGVLPGTNELNELGRSGLPRLSGLVLQEPHDPDFLQRAYDVIGSDYRNSWCDHYFKQLPNGLNRFCDVDYSAEATLAESGGAKNASRFENGDPLGYAPVDLNAWLYRTEKDMGTMASRLGRPEEARQWDERAARRKDLILTSMWDPQSQTFRDLKGGQRSEVETLAGFSVLAAGVLDPDDPRRAQMMQSLERLRTPEGLLWDSRGRQLASSEDVQALLGPASAAVAPYEPPISPLGRERQELVGLDPAGGAQDRRMLALHSSLFSQGALSELKGRGLTELVYGCQPLTPQASHPLTAPFKVGNYDLELPGADLSVLAPGIFQLQKGDDCLLVTSVQGGLLIGDRLYSQAELPRNGQVKLPGTILGSFFRAGGNPALERFFDRHRELMPAEPETPSSVLPEMPGKPGWKRLFDRIATSWKPLTIEPSVVASNSAMPIFHRAAVPSLGIFKTQFNWDTLFMARGMQWQGAGQTVAGMADNLLFLLDSTGRVPNAARSVYLNKSQPPILPELVRMSHPMRAQADGQDEANLWLDHAYASMTRDYQQFWCQDGERGVNQLDGQSVRLSRWGGPNHKFAMDESGFDTTSRFYNKTLDLIPPDLNAFLYRYANDMAAIAGQLGRHEEMLHWQKEATLRKQSVLQHCWDEQDGMFRDYCFQGPQKGLCREQDALAAAIAPLWAGMLDPQVPAEKKMIERSLASMSRFEKEHGLAATAEDYGHPEMQWNGPSGWSPLHMMAIEGALRYGDYASAGRWLEKWIDTIDRVEGKDGVILERYDVVTGGPPPVQKGRYEETQGEGPGFGWTNASVPWGVVEVVHGLKPSDGKLSVSPTIPPGLEGQTLSLELRDPAGRGDWKVEQRYDGQSYSLKVEGTAVPVEVLTPPLPAGLAPDGIPQADGRMRYRVKLAGGQLTQLHLPAHPPVETA